MNEETLAAVEKLMAKMGDVSGMGWEIMLRQAYISGMLSGLFFLLCVAALVAAFVIRKKVADPDDDGVS